MVAIAPDRSTQTRRRVLNGRDIHDISDGASRLPGDWYVDPVIDLRHPRKPRVWLRSDAFMTSQPLIGIERIDRLLWVTLREPGDSATGLQAGRPFETISSAIVFLAGWLEAIVLATNDTARSKSECG